MALGCPAIRLSRLAESQPFAPITSWPPRCQFSAGRQHPRSNCRGSRAPGSEMCWPERRRSEPLQPVRAFWAPTPTTARGIESPRPSAPPPPRTHWIWPRACPKSSPRRPARRPRPTPTPVVPSRSTSRARPTCISPILWARSRLITDGKPSRPTGSDPRSKRASQGQRLPDQTDGRFAFCPVSSPWPDSNHGRPRVEQIATTVSSCRSPAAVRRESASGSGATAGRTPASAARQTARRTAS